MGRGFGVRVGIGRAVGFAVGRETGWVLRGVAVTTGTGVGEIDAARLALHQRYTDHAPTLRAAILASIASTINTLSQKHPEASFVWLFPGDLGGVSDALRGGD